MYICKQLAEVFGASLFKLKLKLIVMKKSKLVQGIAIILVCSIAFSSCIGSFGLSKKVLGWNHSVGNKFVNELVFVAFWILPVYEVTLLADVLVLNSVEFWSGSNPVAANTKHIKGEKGEYLVETSEKGYTITNETTQEVLTLAFDSKDNSWSAITKGETIKLLTFVDDNHVNMYMPDGKCQIVELSQAGLLAYKNLVQQKMYFAIK